MQNFAEKDLFFTIFLLFFKKKVFFLTMRAVCMQKNAHFARASDQKRARLTIRKINGIRIFQDMGFFFLAQGSFLAHHERKTWLVTVARGPVSRHAFCCQAASPL